MWKLYKTASLCLLYWISYVAGQQLPGLHGENTQKEVILGDDANITCEATLQVDDSLALNIPEGAAQIVSAQSLDNLIKVNLLHESMIKVEEDEIAPENPPNRVVRIIFTINSVRRDSSGVYTCQYNGAGGQKTVKQELVVLGPPQQVDVSSSSPGVRLEKQPMFDRNSYPDSQDMWWAYVSIDEQGPFELKASVTSNPQANVNWKFHDYIGNALTIDIDRSKDDVEDINENEVFVSAKNQYGSYNATIIIKVQYKPREPTIIHPELYPEENKKLIAECVFDAEPAASVWYVKINPETDAWERIDSDMGNKLFISNVILERDVGQYKCLGQNDYGMNEGYIYIHGKPRDANIIVAGVYGTSADLVLKAYSAIPVSFELYVNSTATEDVESSLQQVIAEGQNQNPPNISLEFPLNNLNPDTEYALTVNAINRHGSSHSEAVVFTTASKDVTRPPQPEIEVVTKAPETDKNPNTSAITKFSFILLAICLFIGKL